MNYRIGNSLATLALLVWAVTLNPQLSTCLAQGTPFTYQGRLNDGTRPASGSFDFRFRLAADPLGNTYVGPTLLTNELPVSGGLFSVPLDFGEGLFAGAARWLEIGVRTNGGAFYTTLAPLQALTPAPYAMMANSASNLLGTLPASQLSGTISNAALPGSPSFSGTVAAGAFAGDGAGVINVNAQSLNGLNAGSFWQLGGNNVADGQFLGSINGEPVVIAVNGMPGWQLLPTVNTFYRSNIVNLVGGSSVNYIAPGVYGSVIAGGGAGKTATGAYSNSLAADFSFLGGGFNNSIQSNASWSFLGGGVNNFIQTSAARSFLGGGSGNSIETNATYSFVGGGYANTGGGMYSTVVGGANNKAGYTYATVGGGYNNTAALDSSTVGGGWGNTAGAASSTVAGGENNTANGRNAAVGGGNGNQATNTFATVPGGKFNLAGASEATVSGGAYNQALGFSSVVGGGGGNSAGGDWSVVAGGRENVIQSNAFQATLPGGLLNVISNGANYASVGGGQSNLAGASEATVSGGAYNQALGFSSVVGGGGANTASGDWSVVAGGRGNTAGGLYSFAAGYYAQATNQGAFVWADQSSTTPFGSTSDNQFCVRASGGVRFSDSTPSLSFGSTTRQMLNLYGSAYGIGVQNGSLYFRCNNASASEGFSWYKGGVHNDAYANPGGGVELMHLTESGLWVRGTFVSSSDRESKASFAEVDSREVLEKVAALPISSWNYKADPGTRHLGPMAQDFYGAFCIGPDDKHIAVVDEGGVALAAIQGLNQKLEEKNAALERKVAELEILVNQLAAKVSRRSP